MPAANLQGQMRHMYSYPIEDLKYLLYRILKIHSPETVLILFNFKNMFIDF